ncbi:glycoside hydrolase family 88 protein [Paenibacillus sp. HWE-109]|uniref:glycoside hydrolase family 88/105 protein n=1 Tax=Paenibacillus sp. HWE-109 TaxID=1306526 RepID=UPI001EDE90E5|nr:glycoside hydrolase family 88 protein [Paenibacillus sp. HWE-109]UKS27020.1 glycoside hydrolase family 88 protein [Paenibacillus sp. HWE-109]
MAVVMKEHIRNAADRVYRYMTESRSTDWGMNIHEWDWVPGVGTIALLHYYDRTGNKDVLDYLIRWVERNQEKAGRTKVINSMAPFAIFPRLYELTKETYYLDQAKQISQWIVQEAPRTREGAFEHTVTEKDSFPEQVWADTIFMAVLLLARTAKATNDASLATQALEQVSLHLRLLQDEATGVLFHGWNCVKEDHLSAARWTRANAWVCVAVPEILQEIAGLVAIPEQIRESYKRMMDGLITYQNEHGLWHTVMDRSDFYQETSGSAGIACGMMLAIRTGMLNESYRVHVSKALDGVLSKINATGEVNSVSGGTPIMPTIEAYQSIEQIPTLYGQGLVLMLLAECSGLA